ncbi:MAG: hypothetical protein WCY59_04210 [Anaerovoracaceae bacterium]
MTVTVQIEGVDKLRARLKDPQLVKEPLKELLKDASDIGKAVARHNLSGGTEQAKISMTAEVKPMEAVVYSKMAEARAKSIEEGRSPGETAPFTQLARWVTGRRYLTARRLSELTKDERAQVEAVQAAIKAGGSRAKKFIAGAAEAVKKDLPKLFNVMARKVEARWKSR